MNVIATTPLPALELDLAPMVSALDAVPETLFIPLWAKAVDARSERPILGDRRAPQILSALPYNWERFAHALGTQVGCCIRARWMDERVRDFVDRYPDGVVIELGPGLDGRSERCGDGATHWYELDLPEVMALRRHFYKEGERRTQIESDILHADWPARIRDEIGDSPVMVVSEGVFPYFDSPALAKLFQSFASAFGNCEIVFDSIASAFLPFQRFHDAHKYFKAEFTWGVRHPRQIQRWAPGFTLLESATLASAPDYAYRQLPRYMRLAYGAFPWFKGLYRFNRFRLSGASE